MINGIEDVPQTCHTCGRQCNGRRSIANHIARSHKDIYPHGLLDYTLKHITDNKIPVCKCGCGKDVSWCAVTGNFKDYISGHNASGFRVKQPSFTKEQIRARSESIKNTYKDPQKRAVILNKISTSVKDVRSSDEQKEKSKQQTVIKQQEKKHIVRQTSSNKRVFTLEFAKKVENYNASNWKPSDFDQNLSVQHSQENKFYDDLVSVFGAEDIERAKFVDTLCIDFYIKSIDTYIDYDDAYAHGLDRNKEWSLEQIDIIANDLDKNAIVRDLKLNYLRINNVDHHITKSQFGSDLQAIAYHICNAGEVVIDGSFEFEDDYHPIISREDLIRINEVEIFPDAKGRDYTTFKIMPVIKTFFKNYVKNHGWFYPISDQHLVDVLRKLNSIEIESEKYLQANNHGSTWLKSRSYSYWDVLEGPVEAFDNDKILERVLAYRLGLNASKLYDYVLSDKQQVSCKETFEINMHNVRNGFMVQRNKVSWFKPAYAVDIYKRFIGKVESPVVWDPSIGFSARLLGFAGAFSSGTYIGTDPSGSACRDAEDVAAEVKEIKKNLNFDIRHSGSESIILENNSLDLVFTSPPYFNKEKYTTEPGQCWADYPDIKQWQECYLKPTLQRAYDALKPGCRCVFNIGLQIREIVLESAIAVGFVFDDELELKIQTDHFSRGKNVLERKNDPVLVFLKE